MKFARTSSTRRARSHNHFVCRASRLSHTHARARFNLWLSFPLAPRPLRVARPSSPPPPRSVEKRPPPPRRPRAVSQLFSVAHLLSFTPTAAATKLPTCSCVRVWVLLGARHPQRGRTVTKGSKRERRELGVLARERHGDVHVGWTHGQHTQTMAGERKAEAGRGWCTGIR